MISFASPEGKRYSLAEKTATLWNDVFNFAKEYIGIPRGNIRATVLIETILAAFEMDEILYEPRAGAELRAMGLHVQLH